MAKRKVAKRKAAKRKRKNPTARGKVIRGAQVRILPGGKLHVHLPASARRVGNPNESQYVDSYLATNDRRGRGHGLTVATFLAYNLRGKAKRYSNSYATALHHALAKRLKSGQVVRGDSSGGGEAYYSTSDY